MTVKRVLLNTGMILTLIAAVIFGIQKYDNSFLESAEGTVLSEYYDLDGFYNVKYHADRTHTDGIYLPEAAAGDRITVLYDRRCPEKIAYKLNLRDFIGMFGIPGILMIICCCTAFKGYKTEFIDKMSKPAKFAVLSVFADLILIILICGYGFYDDSLKNAVILFLGVPAVILLTISANVYVHDTYKYRKKSSTE